MTDKECVERFARWHADGSNGEECCVFDRMIELAKAGIASQPPAGSVKVRIAVTVDHDDGVFTDAFGPLLIDQQKAMQYVGFNEAKCAAIIEAWIPPVAVPVVDGVTVEYSPHREQSTQVEP